MATEIERKFLILNASWRDLCADGGTEIRQFYLAIRDGFSLRIRILNEDRAVLTLKTGAGLSRGEYEYGIPLADALDLVKARIGNVIEKRRYRIDLGASNLVAEVDVFAGHLASLVTAEVELPQVDHDLDLPAWFGPEVTGDPAYLNAQLALADGLPLSSSDVG